MPAYDIALAGRTLRKRAPMVVINLGDGAVVEQTVKCWAQSGCRPFPDPNTIFAQVS